VIDRREIVSSLLSAALLVPFKTMAQPSRKVWRVGYLSAGSRSADGAPPAAFRQALADRGYVDGQNVTYIGRWAEGKIDRLSTLASEPVGMKADAIVAFGGGPAAQALKLATSSIPIVFAGAGDPVGVRLVHSLSRPGGNVTGISAQATELSAKRLDLLKAMVPKATRIAVLWNADDPAMTLRYQEIEKVAPVYSSGWSFFSLARPANSLTSLAICAMPFLFAPRMTGVINPSSIATATPTSASS